MTSFVPTIEAFFLNRLLTQRNASPRTIAAYRDTLRVLLTFAKGRLGSPPLTSTSPTSTPNSSGSSSPTRTRPT